MTNFSIQTVKFEFTCTNQEPPPHYSPPTQGTCDIKVGTARPKQPTMLALVRPTTSSSGGDTTRPWARAVSPPIETRLTSKFAKETKKLNSNLGIYVGMVKAHNRWAELSPRVHPQHTKAAAPDQG
jgi:hypothetical protein